jgi:hypothetical protein
MVLKKFISLIIIILIIFLSSCEKDDICIEETTPHLIIRFYDIKNPDQFKVVTNLRVEIEGIEGVYENETITRFTDSISIPIKVTEDLTRFKLILDGNDSDDTNDNEDIFDLSYAREDNYVSRSCGYKTIFFDANTSLDSDSDNWIISLETVKSPQDILNQQSAHVKIFH